jgi:hypothetical protein
MNSAKFTKKTLQDNRFEVSTVTPGATAVSSKSSKVLSNALRQGQADLAGTSYPARGPLSTSCLARPAVTRVLEPMVTEYHELTRSQENN